MIDTSQNRKEQLQCNFSTNNPRESCQRFYISASVVVTGKINLKTSMSKLEYYIEGVVRLVYIATILCTFLILSSVTSRSGADCMSKR